MFDCKIEKPIFNDLSSTKSKNNNESGFFPTQPIERGVIHQNPTRMHLSSFCKMGKSNLSNNLKAQSERFPSTDKPK